MIYIYFLLGAIVYSIGTEITYSDILKKSKYYAIYGVTVGIFANFIWYTIVQKVDNKENLLKLGFYWDSMIIGCFLLIPVLFHGVRPQLNTILGILLIIAGIVLTKIKM